MLSIIYPYRDRDPRLLKNSFESLRIQTINKFEVYLVDFGSTAPLAKEVKILCENFGYHYKYCFTQYQPWNKSKALNSIIKDLSTEYCFVADADMIFHQNFVKDAIGLQEENKTIYFQVGFLEQNNNSGSKSFNNHLRIRKSNSEATGMSMFPVTILKELNGFDEFYHFWGAEDTDMHVRITNAGFPVEFYDKRVLMLHQWHPSYRSTESGKLTRDLKIDGIVQLNNQHLNHAIEFKTTIVNSKRWGESLSLQQMEELEAAPVNFILDNEQKKIDHFLFGFLPNFKDRVLKIIIIKASKTRNYRAKKLLGKKVSKYYSLKEINDKILIHLISFYRNKPYSYKISDDFKSIEVAVRF